MNLNRHVGKRDAISWKDRRAAAQSGEEAIATFEEEKATLIRSMGRSNGTCSWERAAKTTESIPSEKRTPTEAEAASGASEQGDGAGSGAFTTRLFTAKLRSDWSVSDALAIDSDTPSLLRDKAYVLWTVRNDQIGKDFRSLQTCVGHDAADNVDGKGLPASTSLNSMSVRIGSGLCSFRKSKVTDVRIRCDVCDGGSDEEKLLSERSSKRRPRGSLAKYSRGADRSSLFGQ